MRASCQLPHADHATPPTPSLPSPTRTTPTQPAQSTHTPNRPACLPARLPASPLPQVRASIGQAGQLASETAALLSMEQVKDDDQFSPEVGSRPLQPPSW